MTSQLDTGPPRELDADELAFLSNVEAEERKKERQTRAETQKALDEFKVCQILREKEEK